MMQLDKPLQPSESGDGQAGDVSELFRRHRPSLMNYCCYVLGDPEHAAEIVQESFLRMMELTKTQPPPREAKDWLFICARNLCFSRLRDERTRVGYAPLLLAPALSIDAESRRFIEQVLERLDSEERDLILLREQQQYSVREIAGILGISEEAVRVRLYRVRKKMQELGER